MKKIYVAYKYGGVDQKQLRNELEQILSVFEKKGYDTYVFFRDASNWGPANMSYSDIMKTAFLHLTEYDTLFIYLNSEEKSEALLLEVGYAKASGKKIILAINANFEEDSHKYLRGVADEVMEFASFDDLLKKAEVI